MSRINTNITSLVARHHLQRSNLDLATSLRRLSTGLAISRGADNPAGLIVSERLRSEISSISQAIDNAERASNVIATTEAALQEISTLLTSIKGLAVEAANTGAFSQEEVEANQLQIDSAIESITRISNSTSFAGLKVLNGSLDYLTSGVDNNNVRDVKVFGATFGTNTTIPVTVEVLNSAENATLFISGNAATSPGAFLSSVTFELQGPKGVEVFSFVSGTTLSAVVQAVNSTATATGISASLVDAADQTSGMVLTSQAYGSDAFVSARKISNGDFFQTFDQQGGTAVNRDAGEDVLSLVNGHLALGDGLDISLKSSTLNVEMSLTAAAGTTLGTNTFTITGGGALFQVGPGITTSQQVGFGIHSVAASRLGNQVVGFLNSVVSGGDNSLVAGKSSEATLIMDASIDQIAILRGRLGAFERNTLETTIRSQQIALENLTASESSIRDTDFAEETARLTRAQILVNAGTSTLGIANSTAQNVLALLQ
ncbi:MAG: flagellin [Phycisphaeraceae bacterium]|nr:flagellin [Phycisphaeraceae bacterium]